MEKVAIQNVENKTQISFSIRQADKMYFVLVENIAFIYVEDERTYLVDFNGDKHLIINTLETLESLLSAQQFYRINRQMLINRRAIKDVETFSNQRMIVHLTIPTFDCAIVPRAKVKSLLNWIEKGQ